MHQTRGRGSLLPQNAFPVGLVVWSWSKVPLQGRSWVTAQRFKPCSGRGEAEAWLRVHSVNVLWEANPAGVPGLFSSGCAVDAA